jgi:YVTN family beta-propeller protein
VSPDPPRRPGRRSSAFRAGVALMMAAHVAGSAGTAQADEGPPVTPGTRLVMNVGNNWDGTVDVVDPATFQVLRRLDVVPDLAERLAEIRSDPERLAFYLAIRQFVGEGNDQFADDMFTSHDGRHLYVSRPSLADVVSMDLATEQIAWRFPMEGQRSDHMGISPDGTRLLVSDSTANKVHVLDTATGRRVAQFASGDSPHESTVTKDGSRVFHASIGLVYTPLDATDLDTLKGERYLQVVDTSDWSFDRHDLSTNLAAREGAVPGQPYPESSAIRPMAVAPDENTLYLQLSFFHGYVAYDVAARRITQVVHLPNLVPDVPREQYLLDSAHHGLTIDPSGRRLCAAGTMSDYAAIVPVADPASHVRIDGIDKPYWSTNGPEGRHCWVSASGADEVVVIDYATGAEVTRIGVGDHPQRMRLGVVRTELLRGATPTVAPTATTSAGPPPSRGRAATAAGRDLPATGLPVLLPAGALLLVAAAAVRRRRR